MKTLTPKHNKYYPHWYRIYSTECVLCGRSDEWRERIYGEKPKKAEDRYSFSQYACGHHFS